jgi:hypothetical protein
MDSFCKSMDLYRFEGHKSGVKKIQFVLWITNPDFKRFGLYRDNKSSQFSKDSTCFHESNKSLKIKICDSWILTNPDCRIRESRFANPDPKNSICGFISEKKFQITRFVSEGYVYDSRILRLSTHWEVIDGTKKKQQIVWVETKIDDSKTLRLFLSIDLDTNWCGNGDLQLQA